MKRKIFLFVLTLALFVGISGQNILALQGATPFSVPNNNPPGEMPSGSNPAEGHYYGGGFATEGWPYGNGYFNPYAFLNQGQDGQYLPYYYNFAYTYDNPRGFMMGNYETEEYSTDPYAYHPMTYLPYIYNLNPNGGYMANGILYPTYTYDYSYGSYPVYYHKSSDIINSVPYNWDPMYYFMYPYQNTQFDDWGGPGSYANPIPVEHMPLSFNNPFSLFDYWGGWLYKKGEHPLLKGLPNIGIQQNLSPNNPLKYMNAIAEEKARIAAEEAAKKAKEEAEKRGETGNSDSSDTTATEPVGSNLPGYTEESATQEAAPTERKRNRREQKKEDAVDVSAPTESQTGESETTAPSEG